MTDKFGKKLYGSFLVSSILTDEKEKHVVAHRVSWELENGPIPDEIYACHHCDNPACVRPSHLFLGNQQANMDDMRAKGRSTVYKLTSEKVIAIRREFPQWTGTHDAFGSRFGITGAAIRAIISRKVWKYI